MGNKTSHHKSHAEGGSKDLTYDPRSPSSRTPVATIVKERKASIVPFCPETPDGTEEADFDPRSPSSRTPVADLVQERKLSVVEFHGYQDSGTASAIPSGENQLSNLAPAPAAKPPSAKDYQKIAVSNAHKQAQEPFPLR